ncbi:PadR family transcriptional regulator [Actinophytocola algeriensis]|uniref:DNA-binding PadR family transcriptional regulator n=1 Tax=Actinophytocola algeriensis TaxID=1768010 RepID=A0A7W7VHK4_9PSEU|nr:PadR family transcriptional regulator [Actinophytocola algeriensis]MBB4910516.1 DNA-binding PadR family transcriptional regulator [Actinophytocola algeriensis]MBE1480495.1 DNA-binding PadR family transcriptional regulator [Actinophytocola algeriensis]
MRHEHHFRGDPGVFGDPRIHFHPAEARGGVPFPPFPPPPPGGGFGPGFQGGFPGFPGFPGAERLRGARGRGRGYDRHGRGRRSRRGDVRAAILALLLERPMHGYEMIQEIKERSGDLWRPSPGSVYPTLQLLADEGLINDEGQGSRRLYALTDEGRTAAEAIETPPWEEIARDADPRDVNLRDAIGQLMGATMQVVQAASDEQKKRSIDVLDNARRELYSILGEAPPADEDADEDQN